MASSVFQKTIPFCPVYGVIWHTMSHLVPEKKITNVKIYTCTFDMTKSRYGCNIVLAALSNNSLMVGQIGILSLMLHSEYAILPHLPQYDNPNMHHKVKVTHRDAVILLFYQLHLEYNNTVE